MAGRAEPAASRVTPLLEAWGPPFRPTELDARYDFRVHQTGQSMLARRLALAIAVLAGLIGSQA